MEEGRAVGAAAAEAAPPPLACCSSSSSRFLRSSSSLSTICTIRKKISRLVGSRASLASQAAGAVWFKLCSRRATGHFTMGSPAVARALHQQFHALSERRPSMAPGQLAFVRGRRTSSATYQTRTRHHSPATKGQVAPHNIKTHRGRIYEYQSGTTLTKATDPPGPPQDKVTFVSKHQGE